MALVALLPDSSRPWSRPGVVSSSLLWQIDFPSPHLRMQTLAKGFTSHP